MHFTRMGGFDAGHEVPVMVRGEGAYVWDQHGKRYLDGLAGLFTSQIGHGRTELAEAASKQASELAYFPLWTYWRLVRSLFAWRTRCGTSLSKRVTCC